MKNISFKSEDTNLKGIAKDIKNFAKNDQLTGQKMAYSKNFKQSTKNAFKKWAINFTSVLVLAGAMGMPVAHAQNAAELKAPTPSLITQKLNQNQSESLNVTLFRDAIERINKYLKDNVELTDSPLENAKNLVNAYKSYQAEFDDFSLTASQNLEEIMAKSPDSFSQQDLDYLKVMDGNAQAQKAYSEQLSVLLNKMQNTDIQANPDFFNDVLQNLHSINDFQIDSQIIEKTESPKEILKDLVDVDVNVTFANYKQMSGDTEASQALLQKAQESMQKLFMATQPTQTQSQRM